MSIEKFYVALFYYVRIYISHFIFLPFFRFIELQLLRHIKDGVDLIFEVFFLWLRIMCWSNLVFSV